jgi:hypothetical protein
MASQADAMRQQAEAVLEKAEGLHRVVAFFRTDASAPVPVDPAVPARGEAVPEPAPEPAPMEPPLPVVAFAAAPRRASASAGGAPEREFRRF